jgi:hypothetical protein
LAERHISERFEIIANVNAATSVLPGDIFGIGEPVRNSKSLDETFFDPAMYVF